MPRNNVDFAKDRKILGKSKLGGYVTSQAMACYQEISEKTGWTDSEILSNSLRITLAAYKCGQIKLLNEWLKDHDK